MAPAGAAKAGGSDAVSSAGKDPAAPVLQLTAMNPQQWPETARSLRKHLSSLHSVFGKVVLFVVVFITKAKPSHFLFSLLKSLRHMEQQARILL